MHNVFKNAELNTTPKHFPKPQLRHENTHENINSSQVVNNNSWIYF